jgi:hypothetical protein
LAAMANVDYNIDITGKTVKFLTKEDVLIKTDLMRAIYDEDCTYYPSDLDVYLFRKVSEYIPVAINEKIKNYKYYKLYEFVRIIDNNDEFKDN